eukprot:NODE_430_length_1702_cov_115.794918_g313_i0.p5 GENE.NODE_430_length_1702_cov_115.794918_g313_i0~~NODE_430_length_1702_cov_115.794918_g313_i0.p5  ORF type:complete len:64 (+),score=19.17 NODE_430_length_1702_cov_115.794918_g313_i0:2-193(+)
MDIVCVVCVSCMDIVCVVCVSCMDIVCIVCVLGAHIPSEYRPCMCGPLSLPNIANPVPAICLY